MRNMVNGGQIVENLSQKLNQQEKIILLNFYKGVPIKVDAWLKSISAEKAVLQMEPPYSICLSWEGETWLLLEGTGVIGRAVVESFDLLAGRVVLSGFKPENTGFDRRTVARVEPRSHIEVAVENEDRRMIEYLADISTKGIGVRIPALGPQQVFSEGEAVEVSLRLPQGKVVVPGVIQNVSRGEDFYRLGIRFDEEQNHPFITTYIAQRQEAILQILKIRYDFEHKKQREKSQIATGTL